MPSKYKDAIERQGAFGNLFVQYMGCPRGPVGRMGWAAEGARAVSKLQHLIDEVTCMPVIEDVDGGKWIPVNAAALNDLTQLASQQEKELHLNQSEIVTLRRMVQQLKEELHK